MNRAIGFLICWLAISGLHAQQVTFTATAPAVVAMGEQFQLVYRLNAQGTNFVPPSFPGFTTVMGPSSGSSTNMSIINGQMTREVIFSFTYVLAGTEVGKHTIQPAKIESGGKTYSSNTLQIEVVQGSSGLKQGGNKQGGQPSGLADDDLFVRVELNKTKAYVGEQLVATVKVYSRTNQIEFTDARFPTFDGFYTSEIEDIPKQLYRENVNGEVYYAGVFKKLIIFPQKAGELTITPFELQCRVRVPAGVGRDWFGRSVQQYKTVVANPKSKARTVTAMALPQPKPDGYAGAVGNYTLSSSIDRQETKTNEPVTLKYTVKGTGNLKLIDPFKIKFPSDFDTYDPKIKDNITTTESGLSGSKTFEYLIIPRYAGEFPIPAVSFTYFDVQTGQYKTLRSEEYMLKVEKGSGDQSTTVISGGYSKEDVRFIGKDIRYIKTGKTTFIKPSHLLYGTWKFWFVYMAGIVLFVLLFLFIKKYEKEQSDLKLIRNRRANRLASKRLKSAAAYMKTNQPTGFYQELLAAMYGYFSDKLSIPVAELNKDRVLEKLEDWHPDQELTGQLTALLDTCEFARYAPVQGDAHMQTIYNEASRLIGRFEQIIKN
jgi:hypothetical protein